MSRKSHSRNFVSCGTPDMISAHLERHSLASLTTCCLFVLLSVREKVNHPALDEERHGKERDPLSWDMMVHEVENLAVVKWGNSECASCSVSCLGSRMHHRDERMVRGILPNWDQGSFCFLYKALNRCVVGSVRTSAYTFRILLPMPSGPGALDWWRFFQLL